MVPVALFALLGLYLFVGALMNRVKVYYFPQVDIYIKIYKPIFNDYGYVYFSEDAEFSPLCEYYLKVLRYDANWVSIHFDAVDGHKLYITEREDLEVFHLDDITADCNSSDIGVFKSAKEFNNVDISSFYINIEGFLNYVYINDVKAHLIRVDPIFQGISYSR